MMTVDLRFERSDATTPWGFRLIGGVDFDTSLTVIKVAEGSLAERAGMRVGDTVVRVADLPAAPLTHAQAHELISKAGNEFSLAVVRGTIEDTEENQNKVDPTSMDFHLGVAPQLLIAPEAQPELLVAPSKDDEEVTCINGDGRPKTPASLDVKGKKLRPRSPMRAVYSVKIDGQDDGNENVMRADFHSEKIVSSAEFTAKTQFFTQETTTVEEQTCETTEWTTFMQKPRNVMPKDKRVEAEKKRKAPAYKVNLKPDKTKPKPEPEPIVEPKEEPQPEAEPEPVPVQDAEELKEETPNVESTTDDHVPMESDIEVDGQKVHIDDALFLDLPQEDGKAGPVNDPSMEDQLAQVQKQLLALSQLPAAIQATLEAVTQQLSKIVKTDQIEEPANPEEEPEQEEYEDAENPEYTEESTNDNSQALDGSQEVDEPASEDIEQVTAVEPEPVPEEELTPEEREKRDKEEKIKHWNNIWPWRDHTTRVYRISNCPLVPSKVIESKKINFLKYQTPPKTMDHLDKSEVLKLMHTQDAPVKGIAGRASIVCAEQDFYKQSATRDIAAEEAIPPQMEP